MPDYFGNTLTDLQRGVTAGQELDTRRRIAADQAATQLAIQRIVSAIEQQKANQQGQYQQGSLGVQNRQVDANSALAAADMLFNQNKQASDVSLAQERNRLFGREIDSKYPSEGQRLGEQRLKNEQAEREAMRLVEEHNNAAASAAARFNAQLQSKIGATKLSLGDQEKARGAEWFTLDSTAKNEFDTKRKQMEAAGWPTETSAVLDAISKDPDARKVIFDGKQFVPKTMRFSPSGGAPATSTGGTNAIQQLFGTQTTTNAPAVVPAPAGNVFVPGISEMRIPAENVMTNDNMTYRVRASDGSIWNATGAQFKAIKLRDPGAEIIPPPQSPRTASPAANARALQLDQLNYFNQ